MKKYLGIFVFLLFETQICFSQQSTVTGAVVYKDRLIPLPEVSVINHSIPLMKSSTDKNGCFSIEASWEDTLLFLHTGYDPIKIPVRNQDFLMVEMEPSLHSLEEVIVVAYGNSRKSSYTGSYTTVDAGKFLHNLPISSFEQGLQGMVPGMSIFPVSGQPGSAIDIRVRGTGSMNAGNNPLLVIDGIPIVSGNIANSGIQNDPKTFNVFTTVNPNDIETVTVLKDASAAALYGSRAANGVILINTRRGREGKTTFQLKAGKGISDWAIKTRPVLNGDDQYTLTYEAFYNEALENGLSETDALLAATTGANEYSPKREKYSDWESALFNKGVFENYEVSFHGGNSNTLFYSSLGYRKERGMMSTSKIEGFNGKLNVSYRSSDKLTLGGNITFSKQHASIVSEFQQKQNPYYASKVRYKPSFEIYDKEGYFREDYYGLNYNPVKERNLDKNYSDVFRSLNALWLEYSLLKDLKFRQTISYDFILNESTFFWPPESANGQQNQGSMSKIPYQRHNLYSSSLLTFQTDIKNDHSIDVLIGWDVDERKTRHTKASAVYFSSGKLPEMENAVIKQNASSGHSDDHLISFLSRLNYSYKDKYMVSATFRSDGSSRLGADNRWGKFWSVSAAWNLKTEKFLRKVHAVNYLKLRTSYGVSGNLPSELYAHYSLFGMGFNYNDQPGSASRNVPNPNLEWEKSHTSNAGIEAFFWNYLYITVDIYHRKTKDLLQDVPISLITGFPTALKNVGSMENKGYEITLSLDLAKKGNLQWNLGVNLAHNKNKVTKLYDGKEVISEPLIIREGEVYNSFYSREWAGVDPVSGKERWYLNQKNSDGTINRALTYNADEAEKIIIGNSQPKLTGGFHQNLFWKNIELNMLFCFSFGGHIFDEQYHLMNNNGGSSLLNIGKDQLKRWQKPGDITDVPKRINNYRYYNYRSSLWKKSNDYIRLKSLSLSYTLPEVVTNFIRVDNIKLFASGINLFTWCRYDGVDPEQSVSGLTTWAWPSLKTYTFGIEIQF